MLLIDKIEEVKNRHNEIIKFLKSSPYKLPEEINEHITKTDFITPVKESVIKKDLQKLMEQGIIGRHRSQTRETGGSNPYRYHVSHVVNNALS